MELVKEYELTMGNLEKCFDGAWEKQASYVGVLVFIPGNSGLEVIINAAGNFAEKLKYYKNAYDEKLNHKFSEGIKIVGFTYGNSFAEIQEDLGV